MNLEQKDFFNYMLERVKPGKASDMERILGENFKKQETLPLNRSQFEVLRTQLLALIEPKFMTEVVTIMSHFAELHVKG